MPDSTERRSDDDDAEYFAPPGTVHISPAAIELARRFLAAANKHERNDWIVVFDWAHTSVKDRPDAQARDLGWSLGLGASRRSDIPNRMIHRVDAVEFAVQAPPDVIVRSEQRLIDVEPTALFGVTLR